MKVLSLFDGISCGMVALERIGASVDRYCAYEIEDSAIAISKKWKDFRLFQMDILMLKDLAILKEPKP